MNFEMLQSYLLWGTAVFVFILIPTVMWLVPPPFFNKTTIEVPRGSSISEVAQELADEGVIYSPELVTIPFRISSSTLAAGTYSFSDSISAASVVRRLMVGNFGVPQAKVVIPEGFTNHQVANRLEETLSSENFSKENFLTIAASDEGFLYPDTYYLHPNASEREVIEVMKENFYEQTKPIQRDIRNFGKSLEDVVKMASLIEREASDYEDRRRIAGILWNRIEIDMPLQVDAVFAPLLGKSTYDLTREDLATDSPYNLYVVTGLPPTAIANPGLDAIKATIDPIDSPYLFYLSDRVGNFYYAETLEGHIYNRRTFLNAGR